MVLRKVEPMRSQRRNVVSNEHYSDNNMNKEGLMHECTVSGPLSFILHISRFFGIAPLTFKNMPYGWRIRVSMICNLHGILLTAAVAILSIVPSIDNISNVHYASHLMEFMRLADLANSVIVMFAAAWTGIDRMRYMINCVVQLQQINKELQVYRLSSHLNNNKNWLIVASLLLVGGFTLTINGIPMLIMTIHDKDKLWLPTFFIFYTILNLVILLVVIQLVIMMLWVLQTFQLLNSGLQSVLQEIYKERATFLSPESILIRKEQRSSRISLVGVDYPKVMGFNKSLRTAPAIIHRLARLYCAQCDIIRQLNDSNSLVILMLYVSFLMHLIIVPYRLVVDIYQNSDLDLFSVVRQLIWVAFYFMKLMAVTESCHRVHEEMATSEHLLNQMFRYTTTEDFNLVAQLKWFYRHVVLNDVTFTLYQFFPIDRSLAVGMIGSIATYLVIAVQFL